MDILKNKTYESYNYPNRYSDVPYYYNTVDQRQIYGIGSQVVKDGIDYVSHKVEPTDTLDYLSLKYYNDPTYWWYIAYFNDIMDSMARLSDTYLTIKIPNIAGIEFGEER